MHTELGPEPGLRRPLIRGNSTVGVCPGVLFGSWVRAAILMVLRWCPTATGRCVCVCAGLGEVSGAGRMLLCSPHQETVQVKMHFHSRGMGQGPRKPSKGAGLTACVFTLNKRTSGTAYRVVAARFGLTDGVTDNRVLDGRLSRAVPPRFPPHRSSGGDAPRTSTVRLDGGGPARRRHARPREESGR
ncbi:hypothetical protein E5288_WYG007440 [Bos mutus]|uniref:Uncharacterized protein n=1 Tax=Bos mutus TaxID=72004 RepID=A0A6B0SFQ5_9CETA|nr:hypothetical protein [Bos mutus]